MDRAEKKFAQLQDRAILVPGGKTPFYVHATRYEHTVEPDGGFGMFFRSSGQDLHFTRRQANVLVEFFRQNNMLD